MQFIGYILDGNVPQIRSSDNILGDSILMEESTKTDVRKLSEDVLMVTLNREPFAYHYHGFASINQIIANEESHDVIVNFHMVKVVTSSILSNLLILHKLLCDAGHRLILCNVNVSSKYVFRIAGLRSVFDFAEDKFAALAALECEKLQVAAT